MHELINDLQYQQMTTLKTKRIKIIFNPMLLSTTDFAAATFVVTSDLLIFFL